MDEKSAAAGLERRREDYALITGQGHYVDDLRSEQGRPPALHLVFVRSPYAHAEIGRIQLDAVRALPGVVAAFAGAELVRDMPPLEGVALPGQRRTERRPLALGRARYVGDPVAVVLAESLSVAEDARELVEIDYEPLRAVADAEEALAPGAQLLYDDNGSNMAFLAQLSGGDIEAVCGRAEHTVRLRLVNQRIAPGSLEARACLFDFDARSGELTAWMSSQAIFRAKQTLAASLGLDPGRIRVYNADVGGAFGAKNALYGEELVAAALAIRFGRAVKWIEGRGESLQAQTHGRGQVNYVEAAFQHDGRLIGLRVRTVADLGAFSAGVTAMVPTRTPSFLSGPYQLQAIESQVAGVFTNKVPTAPYRGAGRPEATYILERAMDRIADELGLDPVEVRRRNFIPPQAFPYKTVTGVTYDSGNYQAALDRLIELGDYAAWRQEQRRRRAGAGAGAALLGIGLATFIELTGDSFSAPGAPREAATVRICSDGTLQVQSGVAHNGQGHFTAFAQIVAQTFQLSAARVEVCMNDSSLAGSGIGTFGSRTTQVAGSAVLRAAEAVREKALLLASRILEVAPLDLELQNGQVRVRGVPARAVALGELARLVEERPGMIEREAPNPANGAPIEGLAAWRDFVPQGAAYASGAHMAVVEVDDETGEVRVPVYVAVDDCGQVLNHYLAEAQIHGSLAQGIGQALYEEAAYAADGQPLSGTLMDYALPLAVQVPAFTTDLLETASPLNPLGVKGVGEAGCIAAPPAIVNAVLDALAPLGITELDMPLKPARIWQTIQQARQGRLARTEPQLPDFR